MEAIGVILCHFHRLKLFQSGFLRNLVFALVSIVLKMTYIRNVSNIANFVADMLQVTEKKVESDGWTSVSEVSITIDSRAADIHADSSWIERFEEFLLPAQRIINK